MNNVKDAPLSAERVRAARQWLEYAAHPDTIRVLGLWPKEVEVLTTLRILADAHLAATTPRPLPEWHEDIGPVLWWVFPVAEPPHAGTPNDWPGYYTHWTPITVPSPPPT